MPVILAPVGSSRLMISAREEPPPEPLAPPELHTRFQRYPGVA